MNVSKNKAGLDFNQAVVMCRAVVGNTVHTNRECLRNPKRRRPAGGIGRSSMIIAVEDAGIRIDIITAAAAVGGDGGCGGRRKSRRSHDGSNGATTTINSRTLRHVEDASEDGTCVIGD